MAKELMTTSPVEEIEISITDDAVALRDEALHAAGMIEAVGDDFDAECAGDALKKLKGVERGIENARKTVKNPVLELGRKIDGIAKDFLRHVSGEARRVSRLLGEYQDNERRKRQEAERKARQEAERIKLEAEARERERIKQETAGRTGTLEQDLEAIRDEEAAKMVAAKQEIATAGHKVDGTGVRKKVCFEVEDEAKLLEARPDLFTPDERKIRAALKLTQAIPGLKVWEEASAYMR